MKYLDFAFSKDFKISEFLIFFVFFSLMSQLSSFKSSASSILQSEEYCALADIVAECDAEIKQKKPITIKKYSRLQYASNSVLRLLDKECGDLMPPALKQGLTMLASGTPVKQISKMIDENESLKQENSVLRERNSILTQMSEQSINDSQLSKTNDGLKRKVQMQNQDIQKYTKALNDLEQQYKEIDEENNKLRESLEKSKNKRKKYEEMIIKYDDDIKELNNKIIEIKKQSHSEEEIQQIKEENESLKKANEMFIDAFNEQIEAFKELGTKYNETCNQRDSLYKYTNQLFDIIAYHEQINEENTQKVLEQPLIQISNEDRIDSLIKILDDMNEDEEIGNILRDQNTEAYDRLIVCFEKLMKEHENNKNNESIEKTNETLKSIVSSQLMFLQQLINSSEMQKLVINVPQNENLRNALIKAFQDEKKCIEEYGISMKESGSLFHNLLPMTENHLTNSEVQKYVEELQSSTDQEPFLFVAQCLTANEILRKYSEKLREIVLTQKNDLEKTQKSLESISSKRSQMEKEIEVLEKENKKLKTVLMRCKRISAKKDETRKIEALCDKVLSGEIELPEREKYIQKLEKKVESQKKKFTAAGDKYKEIIIKLNDAKEEAERKLVELNKNIQNETRKNEQLKDKLEATEKENKQDKECLENQIEVLSNKMNAKDENYRKQVETFSAKLQECRRFNMLLLVKMSEKVKNNKKYCDERIRMIQAQLDGYRQLMTNAKSILLKYATPIIKDLREENDKLRSYSQKQKSVIFQNESVTSKYEEDLQSLNERNKQLNVHLNLAKHKLKLAEENAQRDAILLQKKLDFMKQEKENEKREIVNKAKNDCAVLERSIYAKFYAAFSEFADLSVPVSSESVDAMIRNIKAALNKQKETKMLCSRLENDNKAIASMLQCEDHEDIVHAFKEYFIETQNKLKSLSKIANKSKKEQEGKIAEVKSSWKNWAKQLIEYAYGSETGEDSDEKQMESISNIVMASKSSGTAARKIEMLRDELTIVKEGIDCIQANDCHRNTMKGVVSLVRAIVFMQHLSCCVPNRMTTGIDTSKFPEKPPLFMKFVVE